MAKQYRPPSRSGPRKVAKIRRDKTVAYGTRSEWNDIREAVIKRDGSKCVKCGSTTNLTVDHIIPVSRGGQTVSFNLRTLCRTCHSNLPFHKAAKAMLLSPIKR